MSRASDATLRRFPSKIFSILKLVPVRAQEYTTPMKSSLARKKCAPCEGDVQPLSSEQVLHFMPETPNWQADPEVSVIARTFECKNFRKVMVFVNRVADLAEAEGHHPGIFIHDYRNVTISLTTHAIGGLSENDFIMAAKIDAMTR